MTATVPAIGSSLLVALPLAVLFVWLGILISRRVAFGDPYSGLATVMIASVVLHMACTGAQIYVVNHFYGGTADWVGYTHKGAFLADNWRHGRLMLDGSGVNATVGNGAVTIITGVIMTIVGPDQLAAFVVGAWLAFIGSVFFYKAFAVTFPDVIRRRYALLIFLFPSLLFWTAEMGKESIMVFALGLTAYGMALILVRQGRGYVYTLLGGALAMVVRPDDLVLMVFGFALAMAIRLRKERSHTDGNPTRDPRTVLAAIVYVVGGVVVTILVTKHFLHTLTGANGLTDTLAKVSMNDHGHGVGFGSSSAPFSANPLFYPRDIYTVLFDPLPPLTHNIPQLVASFENVLILVVVLASIPRLRYALRAAGHRPYVVVAFFYSVVFVYLFAALANLGLITRERTLLLPFLFVLLALPVGTNGHGRYPWQMPRRRRRASTLPHRRDNRLIVEDAFAMAPESFWEAVPAQSAPSLDEWTAVRWKPEP